MPLNKSPGFNFQEQAVLDCIPAGTPTPSVRRRLARVACLDDRLIREIIYRLVVERGLPIGSSTGPEGGGLLFNRGLRGLWGGPRRHLKAQGQGHSTGGRRRWRG